jgi:ribosomal protein S18 acetylase RimI-like enzyme
MGKLLYYLNRLGLAIHRRRLQFFQAPVHELDHEATGTEIGVLGMEPLAGLEYCGGWLGRHEALGKLASTPCWLVGAHRAGRLVGYLWGELDVADVGFFDLRIPLPEGVAYLSHVYVAPEARGQGLYVAMCAKFMAEARRRRVERVFLCVDPINSPMIRHQRRLGFRHYLSASYLRCGAWRRYRIETPEGEPVLSAGEPEAAALRLLP